MQTHCALEYEDWLQSVHRVASVRRLDTRHRTGTEPAPDDCVASDSLAEFHAQFEA